MFVIRSISVIFSRICITGKLERFFNHSFPRWLEPKLSRFLLNFWFNPLSSFRSGSYAIKYPGNESCTDWELVYYRTAQDALCVIAHCRYADETQSSTVSGCFHSINQNSVRLLNLDAHTAERWKVRWLSISSDGSSSLSATLPIFLELHFSSAKPCTKSSQGTFASPFSVLLSSNSAGDDWQG